MNASLRIFIRQFAGVVIATLAPVILTAFLSFPFILGGQPGEPRPTDSLVVQHMT